MLPGVPGRRKTPVAEGVVLHGRGDSTRPPATPRRPSPLPPRESGDSPLPTNFQERPLPFAKAEISRCNRIPSVTCPVVLHGRGHSGKGKRTPFPRRERRDGRA